MVHANEYGFLPGNDAEKNARALQAVVDLGGEVIVDLPGIYDLSETVEIGDDTSILFSKGVKIRRQKSSTGKTGVLFLNKGCDTATYNKNIRLIGLHIDCNGVESDDSYENSRLVGLRAQVGMIYVKRLVVEDFECTGLLHKDYGIQISAFEDIRLEHLSIEGNKDAVHLGWGRGFVIRHGKFRTYDDPLALNAFDYATSNTHVGWIEDGLIEDCYDLPAGSTTGFFCRMLGGAWCDWQKGMQVQHSDTVCHDGYVYRAILRPDGTLHTSNTPPSHQRPGEIKSYDGICWACVRNEAVYDCGCRNIVFRDLHLQKERNIAFHISLNYDSYARSYSQGCKPIPQGNLTFERISVENKINMLLCSNYPSEHIAVRDTDLKDTKIDFRAARKIEGLSYPTVDLTLERVNRKENSIASDEVHRVRLIER